MTLNIAAIAWGLFLFNFTDTHDLLLLQNAELVGSEKWSGALANQMEVLSFSCLPSKIDPY